MIPFFLESMQHVLMSLCSAVAFVHTRPPQQHGKSPSDPIMLRETKCLSSFFQSCRGHRKVFEAWFLLVQCAHWVQVAVQLLVTLGPDDCGPLLWLLTFYHHPTNRGHHRELQLVRVSLAPALLCFWH